MLPTVNTSDSTSLDGSRFFRTNPDADGITRLKYRYADAQESVACRHDMTCAPLDEEMRSKVKEAMQEFGTIAPIEFKEVPKSEPLDFKIYGIKTSKNPEIVGFVRHTLMSEKKLFLQNSSENKMKTVCTVEGEKQECVEKQLTDSELQEQKALNDTFSQLLVRHELMHILGAKHPHHAELLNTGFRVNPKEMSDYKNSVMFYESNSGVQPGDEITLGKFDKEYIIRHYGAKRAPKNPNSIKR